MCVCVCLCVCMCAWRGGGGLTMNMPVSVSMFVCARGLYTFASDAMRCLIFGLSDPTFLRETFFIEQLDRVYLRGVPPAMVIYPPHTHARAHQSYATYLFGHHYISPSQAGHSGGPVHFRGGVTTSNTRISRRSQNSSTTAER